MQDTFNIPISCLDNYLYHLHWCNRLVFQKTNPPNIYPLKEKYLYLSTRGVPTCDEKFTIGGLKVETEKRGRKCILYHHRIALDRDGIGEFAPL